MKINRAKEGIKTKETEKKEGEGTGRRKERREGGKE